jgi:hypothetical protein
MKENRLFGKGVIAPGGAKGVRPARELSTDLPNLQNFQIALLQYIPKKCICKRIILS